MAALTGSEYSNIYLNQGINHLFHKMLEPDILFNKSLTMTRKPSVMDQSIRRNQNVRGTNECLKQTCISLGLLRSVGNNNWNLNAQFILDILVASFPEKR